MEIELYAAIAVLYNKEHEALTTNKGVGFR